MKEIVIPSNDRIALSLKDSQKVSYRMTIDTPTPDC